MTAVSVTVAAVYYIVNLRETTRNRKITLTNTILQTFASEEGQKRFIQLLNMEWTSWEDFLVKYDSKVNEDNFAKRATVHYSLSYLGYLMKMGIIDVESAYQLVGEQAMDFWLKLKPINDKYAEIGDAGKDSMDNVEYLVREMMKIKALRDPTYHGSASYISRAEYDRVFSAR